MSIIHEALKKVQNSLKISPPPETVPLTVASAKGDTKGGWKIIVLVLLAVAVLTAGYMYWQGRPRPSLPKTKPHPPVQAQVKAEPKAELEPKPAHADTLNIHGIMSDPKGNVVLIDDGIYAEGDEVNGVKIVKITLDGIVVLKDGKEETIRVGQH